MSLRVYIDTSVFSATFDARLPDRLATTVEFWARTSRYELATSDITRIELEQTPNPELRTKLLELLRTVMVFPLTEAVKVAAKHYLTLGVFSPSMYNDALHVAAAALARHDVLVSWNFKHLVNRKRRSLVNQVNVAAGWPVIEIVAPPEI